MSAKKITLTDQVLTEYRTGPDASGHLRRCAICRRDFATGEHWLRMTRPGEYSVGAHVACLTSKGAQP